MNWIRDTHTQTHSHTHIHSHTHTHTHTHRWLYDAAALFFLKTKTKKSWACQPQVYHLLFSALGTPVTWCHSVVWLRAHSSFLTVIQITKERNGYLKIFVSVHKRVCDPSQRHGRYVNTNKRCELPSLKYLVYTGTRRRTGEKRSLWHLSVCNNWPFSKETSNKTVKMPPQAQVFRRRPTETKDNIIIALPFDDLQV